MNKKLLLALCISVFLLLSPTAVTAIKINNEKPENNLSITDTHAKWTVMMYCAFDNHRDFERDYTLDFIANIGSDDDFNIVTLIDGESNGDTCYCYAKDGINIPLPWYEFESNMGKAKILKQFLELTINSYPADHYALFILTTHGSGWQGIAPDLSGTGRLRGLSLIPMPEFRRILSDITENIGKKLDVVTFDTCVSAMAEVAYEIAPYVDYYISSEEHAFGIDEYSDNGLRLDWNYSYFLQELKNNPNMSSENFSKSIVECYEADVWTFPLFSIIPAPKWYPAVKCLATISTTNLSKISIVKEAVNNLSTYLSTNFKDLRKTIRNARSKTKEYGKGYRRFWWLPMNIYLALDKLGYDCFIDLYDFAEELKNETEIQELKNLCLDVMDSVDNAVIANEVVTGDPSHGLSIYFPQLKCQYNVFLWYTIRNPQFRNIPYTYEDQSFSEDTSWDEFLKTYLKI